MKFAFASCLGLLLALPAAALAGARSNDLLILGSDERYWVAHFEATAADPPNDPRHTVIYSRTVGDQSFSEFLESDQHILAMAHRGSQLGVVEQDGDWTMKSEAETFSTGPDLPGGAKIIDLAGGDDTFWAIGSAGLLPASPATSPATTLPATSPVAAMVPPTSQATTQATTLPASLFRLDKGVWTPLAPIPPQAAVGDVPPSLSIIDQTAYLAFADGPGIVRVVRLDGEIWKDVATLPGDSAVTSVSLLRGTASPVVWTLRGKTNHSLDFLSNSQPPKHVPLSIIPAAAQSATVGYALGRIRVLFSVGGLISEQSLDPSTGAAVGTLNALPLHAELGMLRLGQAMQYLLWTALFLAIFGAMYWRRQMQGMIFDLEKLRLAPLGRRASAGIIDLFPIIIGMAAFGDLHTLHEKQIVVYYISAAPYILLTALTEVIAGRSLGKWLFGLEVVGLTGDRPSRWSLLVRNLLRVIDVGLFFVPLSVVLLSPLRQRTGDVAAGTLVVQSVKPPASPS